MSLDFMFGSGEAGAWGNVDINTLFQDEAGSTPVTATGQSIARWEDQSGNGNHIIFPSGNRPVYQEDGSGIPYISFDGTNIFGEATITIASQPVHFAFALQIEDNTFEHRFVDELDGATAGRFVLETDNQVADPRFSVINVDSGQTVFTANDASIIGNAQRYQFLYNGASSEYWKNGASQTTYDMGAGGFGGITLFNQAGGGTARPMNGRAYGFLIVDREPTSQEVADIDSALDGYITSGPADPNPISGTIEDEAGNPVENAIVKIFTESSLEDQTAPTFVEAVLTDANGDWAMQAAYDETLSYKVEYKKFIAEYSVTIDSSTDSSFTVNSGPFTTGEFDDGQAIAKVTSGVASGDEREITGNANTTTCDIDGTWSTNPAQGDAIDVGYMYSDELKFKPPKSSA